jgi:hypothetical protein
VGAFWNAIGFEEVETAPGTKAWAVELRPGPDASRGADLRQYHELRTGKRVGGAGTEPDGKKLALAGAAHGRWCALAAPLRALVGSEAEWKATVLDRMFPGGKDAPNLGPFDFSKHVVLVIASGETWNCNGIEAAAWEDDRRILVRLDDLTFQSEGGGYRVRPWGVFVLPRRDPFKPVVVQENQQGLIGGPPIWEDLVRFEAFGEKPASKPR